MDDKQQGGVEQAMRSRRERQLEAAKIDTALRALQAEMRKALDACDRVAEAQLPEDPVDAARAWAPLWLATGDLYRRATALCGTPAGDVSCRDDDIAAALWQSVLSGVGAKKLEPVIAAVLRDFGDDARLLVRGHFEGLRERIDAMYKPVLAMVVEDETRARGWTVPSLQPAAENAPAAANGGALSDAPVAARLAAAPTEPESDRIAHALDFAWIRCGRDVHRFATPKQRQIIEMLFGQWKGAGCVDGCGMSEAAVAEHCEFGTNDLRIKRTFSGTTALNTILRKVADDTWALFLNSSP